MSYGKEGSNRVRSTKLLAVLAAILGLLSAVSSARAGNLDSFYLSNDAPLQAGAITADVSGGGSIWYNPAGLANMAGLRLDVSASAYTLRLGGAPDISAAEESGAQVTRMTTTDFQIVPSALTLTHELGGVGLGFGVFVPKQSSTFLRVRVEQSATPSTADLDLLVDYHDRVQEYYAGPSAGFSVSPAVDLGAALFVHYRNELASGFLNADYERGGERVLVSRHSTLDWQQVAVQLVAGVQLEPSPVWRVGFTLRGPSFRVFNVRQVVEVDTISVETGAEDAPPRTNSVFREDFGFASAVVAPPRFHGGVSYTRDETRLAFDLNYQLPLYSAGLGIDSAAVLNARAGLRQQVSRSLALGGGLFSDRSPAQEPFELAERRVDYYGLTLAADITSHYGISSRKAELYSPPTPLVFGTTLALSYALGLGTLEQAHVGSDASVHGRKTDLVVHELSFHFGGWLSE